MERIRVFESFDPREAQEQLTLWEGPRAVIMPHEKTQELWTNSIKVAAKLMSLPNRYAYLETLRDGSVPIHKFKSYDEVSISKEIIENAPSESLRLHPIHHEILLH